MKSKNIKNLLKRVASVTLVGALVLSTGIPAKAATSDILYMTKATNAGSDWTKTVNAGGEATFYVGPAVLNSYGYYDYTGFDSADDATSGVTWTNAYNTDKISSTVKGTEKVADNNFASKYKVTVADNATAGPIRVHGQSTGHDNKENGCDFVVVVEGNTARSASNISVEIYDFMDYEIADKKSGYTVTAAQADANNLFYNDENAAQTYATPANVMDNLLADSTVEAVGVGYGYVNSVTLPGGSVKEGGINTATNEYYGWQYGVISSKGVYDANCKAISASAYDLHDGDTVVWIYGYEADADAYFAEFK